MPMNYSLVVEPFDVWGLDYMGPFPSSNGYTHTLVAIDCVTKCVKACIDVTLYDKLFITSITEKYFLIPLRIILTDVQ